MSYLVDKKRNDYAEFFVNLFEMCNLNCAFCWQNHTLKDGMNKEDILRCSQYVIEQIQKDKRSTFECNVIGGELFFDAIPDEFFDHYLEFALIIKEECDKFGKTPIINWVSNLIFTKKERLKKLLDTLKEHNIEGDLTTSYDLVGRFHKKEWLVTFKENLEYFKPYIKTVSVVLTKPNIAAVIQGNDKEYLTYLMNNFSLFFDHYSPESHYKTQAPNDVDLLKFFYYADDNYPNCQPIKGWRENAINKMTCRSSMIISPKGYTGHCRSLIKDDMKKDFDNELEVDHNENMEELFVKKYNCLSCKFYSRCTLGCYLLHDFMQRGRLTECIFKLNFDYLIDGEKKIF